METGREHFETFAALLADSGFESFLEENDVLRCYIESEKWTDELKKSVDEISMLLTGAVLPLTETPLEERNWNEEWEKTLQPIEVSDRLAIVQRGKPYDNRAGRLLIEINPKMSFGTGYHETTRLMLRLLETELKPDDNVLDIGTGTGVLAIAARKLGNRNPILAIDNDEWSIENAIENVKENQCDAIEVRPSAAEKDLESILGAGKFNLVLANINLNTIETLLPQFSASPYQIKILFSGVLKYDEPRLAESLSRYGFGIRRTANEGEWICVVAVKAP